MYRETQITYFFHTTNTLILWSVILLIFILAEINSNALLLIIISALSMLLILLSLRHIAWFHPLNIFIQFLGLYVIYDLVWMFSSMGRDISFFGYSIQANYGLMRVLSVEFVIVCFSSYLGFLCYKNIFSSKLNKFMILNKRKLDNYWLFFYLLGISAFILILVISGDVSDLLNKLANKGERASGNGWLVLLHYTAYFGILLWYRKNVWANIWKRYGVLIMLLLPLLLYGSRTEFIIMLIAAFYIDECAGRKVNLLGILLLGVFISIFFAYYQAFRVHELNPNLLLAIYKDLSMGVGYAIANVQGFFQGKFHLDTLLLSFSPFVPGMIRESIYLPDSPNRLFSLFLFPDIKVTTFSMGVMGEANYILPYGLSFFYYFTIGVFLSWAHGTLRKYSVISAALIAGITIRIAKGGITAGIANLLELIWPLIFSILLITFFKVILQNQREII